MSANNRLSIHTCPGGSAREKSKKRHYSGKKKRHTQKAQVLADRKSAQLVATAFTYGANMIFNCSRMMATILPNTFKSWPMPGTKVWQSFTKTARCLSRNPNIMR